MKSVIVGLLTVFSVVVFGAFGSIWFADGMAKQDPLALLWGAVFFAIALIVVYVIGEALETYEP